MSGDLRLVAGLAIVEISSWLSTIAALGALVAAVFAALVSTRLLAVERERDVASAAEHLRAGASKVIAWSAVRFDETGARKPDGLVIRNGDTSPIFDIVVSSTKRGGPSHPLHMALLPPGEYFVAEKPVYHWDYAKATHLVRGSLQPVTKHAEWHVTELLFTDASGNRWRRGERGRLEAVEN